MNDSGLVRKGQRVLLVGNHYWHESVGWVENVCVHPASGKSGLAVRIESGETIFATTEDLIVLGG